MSDAISTATESWKPVANFEGLYEVSDLGRVRRVAGFQAKVARFLKHRPSHVGYPRVNLCKDGKHKDTYVHRLVAFTFLGKCPEGYEVNHIDGDKNNNRVTNLEYITRKANMAHAFATGLINKTGSAHHGATLTEDQVREIRKMQETRLAQGMTLHDVGRLYGVKNYVIYQIISGKTWKHVT